jgi:hypothetical protein
VRFPGMIVPVDGFEVIQIPSILGRLSARNAFASCHDLGRDCRAKYQASSARARPDAGRTRGAHSHHSQLRRHGRAAGEFADGGDAGAHRQGARDRAGAAVRREGGGAEGGIANTLEERTPEIAILSCCRGA